MKLPKFRPNNASFHSPLHPIDNGTLQLHNEGVINKILICYLLHFFISMTLLRHTKWQKFEYHQNNK